MKKTYRIPETTEKPFKGKDRFMKDKQKRYVKLEGDTKGTMGYWDNNKCVPMYSLELQLDGQDLTCTLNRQETKNGKVKKTHDTLTSILVGLIVFAVLYLILGVLVGLHAIISLLISIIAGAAVMIILLLMYRLEYRKFYKLLDNYLRRTIKAKPC